MSEAPQGGPGSESPTSSRSVPGAGSGAAIRQAEQAGTEPPSAALPRAAPPPFLGAPQEQDASPSVLFRAEKYKGRSLVYAFLWRALA